ncbi:MULTISPECIES: YiaA/YiaB family inner membrane protein [unclassified Devosia]|jgi:hypothetical protein|uniref:YiaA/YiaB family inner membrane protein n=1 Tax=unclassified Devosia TaxID=196773 RepID=UPI000869A815|nr:MULTISPECIES: YiaA/YiaB family inner membrane protein [unclassified Devosia]ODS87782.1 MAG: hypothetical protein ABS47_11615 [Devosia sp. SCN 66-27]ODT14656.1 MAG: hypothetical protein ABS35_34010 [Kaistia sp. SCN 65-12]RYE46228.1 MAG: hypothetical protein EOP24_16440 [Hyphomicrobiales bacterium]MBL8595619.1 hypothetical protein [Devosia sp.]MBN9360223.1 hypothetical protein [Devosia sp.]
MNSDNNQIYIMFNAAGVAAALFLLSLSLWLAPVDLSTKGYWGMGIVLLMGSLVNLVKYRTDDRNARDVVRQLEQAKNEKILKDYVGNQ